MKDFEGKLRKRRLTIAQLSKKTGISFGYLYKIKRGEANPTMNILAKIAGILQCSVKDLM